MAGRTAYLTILQSYKEVIELADVLGYDIVWQKRRER